MADINIAITKEEIKESDIPQFNNQNKLTEKIKIIPIPTILTVPIYSKEISNSLKKIEKNYYDYYIFASAHSVNIFFETIKNMGLEGKVNLQRIENDGSVKNINLNANNQPTSTTC